MNKTIFTWCEQCGNRINGWWNKEFIFGKYCEKHLVTLEKSQINENN